MAGALLVLNAGSSSLKFAVFAGDEGPPAMTHRGSIDDIGRHASFHVRAAPDPARRVARDTRARDHEEALDGLLQWLDAEGLAIDVAGHRVVHGGAEFARPVRVDDAVLAALERLVPLSPLHQPHSLAGVRALAVLRPEMPQVACFDTAFHHTLPPVAQHFALPRALRDRGMRRYGFHGLSYEHIAGVLPDYLGEAADGAVVVAHLGHGASLCAMRARCSVETSMSFTPLDGIPMGTRCGALDPGVLLHLLRAEGMGLDDLDELLHHHAGLLGVSGLSADVRVLEASDNPHAAEALALFAYRVAQAVAAHAVAAGGLDALVFTAGIGEHAQAVRAAICRHLAWLGVALDDAANARNGPRLTTPASRVSAWVIPTDEEAVIAQHAWRLAQRV